MRKATLVLSFLLLALPLSAQLTPKPAPGTRSATVGDVNGDGLTDVLDDYTWQRNINGELAAPMRLAITGRVIGVLDANGDGAVDLLTTEEAIYSMPPEGPYSLWLNDGRGSFVKFAAPTNTLPSAQGDIHLPPMIADFDGDGKDDFIVPYHHPYPDWQTKELAFYHSRGDGTFEQTDFVTIHLQSEWYMTQVGRQRIAAGDVTGDGKTDIVIKTIAGLVVLAGRGDGKFDPRPERFTSSDYGPGYGLRIADIDGDHNNDVVCDGAGIVTVFFGDGRGGFSRMAIGRAGPVDPETSVPFGNTIALIHFSSTQRWDVALGSQHSNVSVMTYANGALREAARITLADPVPNEGPGVWYRGFNVFAGKFRTDAPADLYAFGSWDQSKAERAFLLFQDKPAADIVVPSRRRSAGRPGDNVGAAIAGTLTLHMVPSYVDLITGRCYGLDDTFELQRDGIFASGTTKSGKHVDALIEPNDEVIRFGAFSGDTPSGTLRRVDDGHYQGSTHWKTTCQGQSFDMKLDAYVQ